MWYALKWFAVFVALGAAGVLIYAATLPDEFRVSRTAAINAPPEKIFPLIDDLRIMNSWNPFAKSDPSIKIYYGPVTAGKGANYSWTSNGRAGQGRMELTGSTAPSEVNMMLHMEKPMEGHNKIVFALKPRGGVTDVSWTMTGDRPYIGKVLGVLFSMEKMVGEPFAQGLADLKIMAEK